MPAGYFNYSVSVKSVHPINRGWGKGRVMGLVKGGRDRGPGRPSLSVNLYWPFIWDCGHNATECNGIKGLV